MSAAYPITEEIMIILFKETGIGFCASANKMSHLTSYNEAMAYFSLCCTDMAEFFIFGTNDLTQATFSFSREDAENKFLPFYTEHKILQDNP